MKKYILVAVVSLLFSCKKDKEVLNGQKMNDSMAISSDSLRNPSINDPDLNGAFTVSSQDITMQKGRAVFSQGGKTQFYFDQNANEGLIVIDGKNYILNQFDFTENNYEISGSGVKISAENGDFKDGSGDCVSGDFPAVKITLNNKMVTLTNIVAQDCPTY